MGSILRVVAAVQMGYGACWFVGSCVWLCRVAANDLSNLGGATWAVALMAVSLAFMCAGGILWTLARIAYPPTPRQTTTPH